MEIRKMTAADINSVAELDKKCFAIPWSQNAFKDEMENDIAVYFVAYEGDFIAGYCGYWRVADEGDITNVAVLPDFRRKGIGSSLIEFMTEDARGRNLSCLTLEVRKSNIAAQNLYRKFGFEIIGLRKRYYSDNDEDALIMMKKL